MAVEWCEPVSRRPYMSEQVTRRTFLRGATAAGVLLPGAAFAQAKKPAPTKSAPAADAIPAGVKPDPAAKRGEPLEHNRAEEVARRARRQPAPGHELSGHRSLQARRAAGQGTLDHGAEPELLEQGAAVRRQAGDLSHVPVLAGAGLLLPGGQGRLRAPARPGVGAQGEGDAGRDGDR